MKKIIPLVILIAILIFGAGCVSPTPPVTPPTTGTPAATPSPTPGVPAVPSLIGDWTGTSNGYYYDQFVYLVYNDSLRVKVLSQDGSLFTGEVTFPDGNGTLMTKQFAGVISADGKMIGTGEYPDGGSNGMFLSADAIELVFRDEDDPSTISIDSVERSVAGAKTLLSTPTMPNLVGNWTGTSVGYMDQSGYQVITGTLALQVTAQEGRLFTGKVMYTVNNTQVVKAVAGVLGRDGKTIQTIEYPSGFTNGVVVTADEIELIFSDTANPTTIAIDTLRRSAAPPIPAGKPTTNLVGNWTGTSTGYTWKASGYEKYSVNLSLKVTDQADRFFRGQVSFPANGSMITKNVAGVFGRDGQTIQLVESPEGYSDGLVVTGNNLQLIYRDSTEPSDIAIDTFMRTG